MGAFLWREQKMEGGRGRERWTERKGGKENVWRYFTDLCMKLFAFLRVSWFCLFFIVVFFLPKCQSKHISSVEMFHGRCSLCDQCNGPSDVTILPSSVIFYGHIHKHAHTHTHTHSLSLTHTHTHTHTGKHTFLKVVPGCFFLNQCPSCRFWINVLNPEFFLRNTSLATSFFIKAIVF